MNDKNLIYQKTTKGLDAIATRDRALGPKLRSMLILVDGKRSFAELEQLSGLLGEPRALMDQLLSDGYIEKGVQAPASAPAPLAAAAPQVPAAALADAKRHASHRLTDALGPNADDVCLRIEGARNLHDFQVAVGKADGLLRQYVSGHVADQIMQDIHSHMPSA